MNTVEMEMEIERRKMMEIELKDNEELEKMEKKMKDELENKEKKMKDVLDNFISISALLVGSAFLGISLGKPTDVPENCVVGEEVNESLVIFAFVTYVSYVCSFTMGKSAQLQYEGKWGKLSKFSIWMSVLLFIVGTIGTVLSLVCIIQIKTGRLSCGSRYTVGGVVLVAVVLPSVELFFLYATITKIRRLSKGSKVVRKDSAEIIQDDEIDIESGVSKVETFRGPRSVMISHIPFEASYEDVMAFLQRVIQVKKMFVGTHSPTSVRVAYVELTEEASVAKAVKHLSGNFLLSQQVEVTPYAHIHAS